MQMPRSCVGSWRSGGRLEGLENVMGTLGYVVGDRVCWVVWGGQELVIVNILVIPAIISAHFLASIPNSLPSGA